MEQRWSEILDMNQEKKKKILLKVCSEKAFIVLSELCVMIL